LRDVLETVARRWGAEAVRRLTIETPSALLDG
jgi:hypothetical protein